MTPETRVFPTGNPFSTDRVQPGAVDYLFGPDESAVRLVDRLRRQGWWGQVVGPHGTGKSTLLASLVPAIRDAGREPLVIALHDGRRRLAVREWRAIVSEDTALVIVDGYEQLSAWSRLHLRAHCWRRGLGLLVTAHHDVGLTYLARTVVTPDLALAVVDRLAPPGPDRTIDAHEVVERLAAHSGNLREALFDLYDLHQRRRHSAGSNKESIVRIS